MLVIQLSAVNRRFECLPMQLLIDHLLLICGKRVCAATTGRNAPGEERHHRDRDYLKGAVHFAYRSR